MNKKIVLTGGGTAGHVMPHVALLEEYEKLGYKVYYIGTDGIEKQIISAYPNVEYRSIRAGKLRRYFDVQNFFDIFNILVGFFQSLIYLISIRPRLVFSKGGFVSVPVSYAAKIIGTKVVTHESDVTPGLANKLLKPVVSKYYYAFEETGKYLPSSISKRVGIPIRADLFKGDKQKGLSMCGFTPEKPVILVMGGSLGAQRLNEALKDNLDSLLNIFQIIHITGKGKSLDIVKSGYKSFEFIQDGLEDIFAATDIVVSRAGANSLFEFLDLKIPMLLIPLEIGSRGDQVLNAESFKKQGFAEVLRETELTKDKLLNAIQTVFENREGYKEDMRKKSDYLYSSEDLAKDLLS